MYTLKCMAGLIVWTSSIGIIVCFAIGGIIFLYNAGVITNSYSWLSIPTVSGGTTTTYEILGYTSFGLCGLFLLMLFCCCSRIRIAVAVCKTAGQFVSHTCGVVLVPIFQTVVNLGMWAVCLVALLYLISAASFTYTSGDVFTSISNLADTALIQFYVFLFGTLWCNAFIQAMGVFVVASACCIWYYSHGPNQNETSYPIFRSYKMVFRYHFGSLAFGSLILAIVQFLQLVVEAVKKQAESSGAANNKCFEYVINCLRCCLQCVERVVEFINKTAYIQIALRGKNFCSAAKDGFEIVWANPLRYMVVSGVGWIIMFLGKLMIAASTTVGFYILITYVSSIQENVLEPIYLLIVTHFLFSSYSSFRSQSVCSLWLSTASPWTPSCSASLLTRPISRPREVKLLSTHPKTSRPLSTWRTDLDLHLLIILK
jgi:solute carrier family 44 (choline transporter-like protein), member 2/4/5